MGVAVHTHVTPDAVPSSPTAGLVGRWGGALGSASDPTSIHSLTRHSTGGFEKLKKKPKLAYSQGFGIHYRIITLSILLQEYLLFFLLDPK